MGIFKRIKEVHGEIKAGYERAKRYHEMSVEEMKQISVEEFCEVMETRIRAKVRGMKIDKAMTLLTEAEKIHYVLNLFDNEVQNGGLCQFFVNSSRDAAPYVSEYLGQVGAHSYQKIYDDFLKDNEIDADDLDSFIISDVEEFKEQCERYPFDDFDDKYYELYETVPLETKVVEYIRSIL